MYLISKVSRMKVVTFKLYFAIILSNISHLPSTYDFDPFP